MRAALPTRASLAMAAATVARIRGGVGGAGRRARSGNTIEVINVNGGEGNGVERGRRGGRRLVCGGR